MEDSTNCPASSNFSKLPRELRDMVYKEVTNCSPAPKFIVNSDYWKPTLESSPAASLLNICSFIRDQVASIVLSEVAIDIEEGCVMPAEALRLLLADLLDRRHVQHIRVVRLSFTTFPGKPVDNKKPPSLWSIISTSLPSLDRLILCLEDHGKPFSELSTLAFCIEYTRFAPNVVLGFTTTMISWLLKMGIGTEGEIPDWVELDCRLWLFRVRDEAARSRIEEVARETWEEFRRGTTV